MSFEPPVSVPRIEAVCFDLDGLMFNTEEVFHRTGTELLRRRGKPAPIEVFHAMMGRRAHEAFQKMIDMMELTDAIADLAAESGEIFDAILIEHIAPMPGLLDLLDLIEARGLPKGVATSSDRKYLTRILTMFELQDRFDSTLTGDEVAHGKPHPEIYLTSAQRLGVQPENMLVLEDSENGTRAAAAAGAYIVSVPHDHSRHHDFSMARQIANGLHDPLISSLLRR